MRPVPPGTAFAATYLAETVELVRSLPVDEIEQLAGGLAACREAGGRLFVLGVGGSAGHASHAVNDFRKICGIEAYAPTDNVSSSPPAPTTRAGTPRSRPGSRCSRLDRRDALLVFSVGGGDPERNVSPNIVHALGWPSAVGARSSASSAATAATRPRWPTPAS